MLGPNALSEKLLEAYLRYLFSAHPVGIHNMALETLLRNELRAGHALRNGPIVELDPASRKTETVASLVAQGQLCDTFGDLKSDQTSLSARQLYSHQVSALRALNAGKSIVVASGTGSGKTEAWLYPVVSALLAKPRAGLRAIVIYPMNALADDQRRIRMRNLLADTPITYGEYTGNTPYDESDSQRIDYNAPRNELQTRAQMRATPPNILITNPSMLEYLLLRPEDNRLFVGADLGFLVLDEAHTYRGAYGIELGHLIRRLKARLGVKKGSLRAAILSATIDRDLTAIAQFAFNLTGEEVDASSIFFGEHEVPKVLERLEHRPAESYAVFTPAAISEVLERPENVSKIVDIEMFGEERVLSAITAPDGARALWELLHDDANVVAVQEKLATGPQHIHTLAQDVFGPHDVDLDQTIARLVDVSATAREASDTVALLPARYHLFLRGLDGVRVCFNPEHGAVGDGVYAIGTAYLENRDICECGYPLWELLVCRDCAGWYLRDRQDRAKKLDVDEASAENTLHLVDPDEEPDEDNEPTSVSSTCMLCRLTTDCNCSPETRRPVVHVKSRKTCVNCEGDVMGVMTGTMAPTQVLAEVLTSEQDPDPKYGGRGSGKKLLTFSDSRVSAAQFAAQLDRAHRQHVQRAAIYQALKSCHEPVGLEMLAALTAKVLQKHGYYKPSADNHFRAKALVFAEFTASYASRRRLEALGLGASKILLDRPPPQGLVEVIGSIQDAQAVTQALLEVIQYDSAVSKPDLMPPLPGYAGIRPNVYYGLSVGPKRWISPTAPTRARRRNRVYNLAERLVGEQQADELLTQVWRYALADEVLEGVDNSYQIDNGRLEFFNPEVWYRCSSCRRVTPWALSGGRGCLTRDCQGTLLECDDVVEMSDHFARNIIDPIEYFRIEEHTAQLSGKEARAIGALFRNGDVNILSCSTTFELGVDIGTLQSVFMRNVPPTVANYRQRAGRAGRTRQGAAFLATYCGPSPHDRVFFENPNDIIIGELAIPNFHLANRLLGERHINSLLFSSLWRFVSNRHGECRNVEQFLFPADVQETIGHWASQSDPILDGELQRYASELGDAFDQASLKSSFCADLSAHEAFARSRVAELHALLPALSGPALQNASNEMQRIRERGIIEYLSARAFLPSYAFPIYVVELRTSDDSVDLQRDLKIAISEYAPGNQVVANKKPFESVAVVLKGPSATAKTPYLDFWYCDSCQAAYKTAQDHCDCGSGAALKHANYIVPDGFLADMTRASNEIVARGRREVAKVVQHVISATGESEVLQIGPIRARKFEKAEFLFVNHGKPPELFRICLTCGVRVRGKSTDHKTAYGKKCVGTLTRCFLGHHLVGEALSLEFMAEDGLQAPDDNVFYQTLAHAIVEGVSKALSIERRDLGTNVRRVNRDGHLIWEILVLDNVPGGAGYVAQILQGDGLKRSFREAEKIASCSNCPEESTCYACLRTMSNQAIHDQMQRGPVKRFLAAVCERVGGNAAVFGVNVDSWLQQRDIEEAMIAVPVMTDAIAFRVLELGNRTKVTVVVGDELTPEQRIWLDTWRTVWPKTVRLSQWSGREAVVGVNDGRAWKLVRGVASWELGRGDLEQGILLEDHAAAAYRSTVLRDSRDLGIGSAYAAISLPLLAGTRTDEKELFGHIFDNVTHQLTIADPYLFEPRHEKRLCAWLDLPKTQVRCIIETRRPKEAADFRQQDAMFARLHRRYDGKHKITVRYKPNKEMHDRDVTISGEMGTVRISLPKGLDFISSDGVVEKNTSATIINVSQPALARV